MNRDKTVSIRFIIVYKSKYDLLYFTYIKIIQQSIYQKHILMYIYTCIKHICNLTAILHIVLIANNTTCGEVK